MSVPPSRVFASVLRQKFGATDDAVRMLPATLADTVPPAGYAYVEIGGEEYRVPSMFGTVERDSSGGVANAGALVWLLTTQDRIVATPGPTGNRAPRTFPEIEGIWDVKEAVHPAVEGDVFLAANGDVWYHVGPDDPPPEWRFCFNMIAPPAVGTFEIKLFPDEAYATLVGGAPVTIGDELFTFTIPEDLDYCQLLEADAFVTTAATGYIELMVRNLDQTPVTDLLTTPISIDAGEYTAKSAALPPAVLVDPLAVCRWGHRITIDVTAAGSDNWGLGVILKFGPEPPT